MTVSHEDIMAEIRAMKDVMVTKTDLVPIQSEIAEIKVAQDQTKEIVEAIAFMKTGSKLVVWMSKVTAAVIAVWVVAKGGAQFLMELGKQ